MVGESVRPGRLIVFSAPSGAGKSSLKDALMSRFSNLKYSVSATTRLPRPGELDGIHYFFKTPEQFHDMIEHGELVEYNEVHGNFYGTPKEPIDRALAAGHSVILDLDVYGKVNFDRVYPDAVGILIKPPSLKVLEERLRTRSSDPEEAIALRLKNAAQELEFAESRGKYEYTVENDVFKATLQELTDILGREMGVEPDLRRA